MFILYTHFCGMTTKQTKTIFLSLFYFLILSRKDEKSLFSNIKTWPKCNDNKDTPHKRKIKTMKQQQNIMLHNNEEDIYKCSSGN